MHLCRYMSAGKEMMMAERPSGGGSDGPSIGNLNTLSPSLPSFPTIFQSNDETKPPAEMNTNLLSTLHRIHTMYINAQ